MAGRVKARAAACHRRPRRVFRAVRGQSALVREVGRIPLGRQRTAACTLLNRAQAWCGPSIRAGRLKATLWCSGERLKHAGQRAVAVRPAEQGAGRARGRSYWKFGRCHGFRAGRMLAIGDGPPCRWRARCRSAPPVRSTLGQPGGAFHRQPCGAAGGEACVWVAGGPSSDHGRAWQPSAAFSPSARSAGRAGRVQFRSRRARVSVWPQLLALEACRMVPREGPHHRPLPVSRGCPGRGACVLPRVVDVAGPRFVVSRRTISARPSGALLQEAPPMQRRSGPGGELAGLSIVEAVGHVPAGRCAGVIRPSLASIGRRPRRPRPPIHDVVR